MLKLLICSQGHFWESSNESSTCPECGGAAEAFPHLELTSDPLPPVSPVPMAAPDLPIEVDHLPVVPGYSIEKELPRGPAGIRRFRAKQDLVGRPVLLEVVLAREDGSQRAWSSLRS
ncbi:MAG: hypothetical protein U0840_21080, partial [Gemmataceae bacterium]